MSNAKVLLFCLLIIFSFDLTAQSENTFIIGRWKGVKMDLRNGETGEKYTLNGQPYETDDEMVFQADGKVNDITNKMIFSYQINSKILSIGDRKFIIQRLLDSEMVLIEYSEDDPENPLAFRTYYVKEKK